MKQFSHRGESLVGIIVGVTIIAIVIGSIAKILSVQYLIEDEYLRSQMLFILQNNSSNIVKKVDTTTISENEVFAVYKDTLNHQYFAMTGSTVEVYKYIDRRGNWVSNTGSFTDVIFTQLFTIDKNDFLPGQGKVVKGEVRELLRR